MRRSNITFKSARDHLLAGLLLLISVSFLVSRNNEGLRNLRLAGLGAYSYLEKPLSSIRVYRTALLTNTELQRQNILLNDELSKLRSAETKLNEYERMLELSRKTAFKMKPVTIVGKNLSTIYNSLTIDKGSLDNVQTGMALISSRGLLGRVILTSTDFAQIMPFTNPLFRASARVQGTRAYGILASSQENLAYLKLEYIPQTVQIDLGAIVETSGYSFQFPAGIPIGKVVKITPEPGRDYQSILVEPYENLNTISEGFVVFFKADSSVTNLQEQYGEFFQ